jgi:hypothetical protein
MGYPQVNKERKGKKENEQSSMRVWGRNMREDKVKGEREVWKKKKAIEESDHKLRKQERDCVWGGRVVIEEDINRQ